MPALRTLHYLGAMATRHIIDNVDSLEEVVLAIKKPQVKLQEPNLRELLSLVGNVQSLMLSPWCIEVYDILLNLDLVKKFFFLRNLIIDM